MSKVEQAFCRSAPWRAFARRIVLPWALERRALRGDVLEIGGGSGAMAEAVMRRFPAVRLTVIDYDPAMVASASRRLRDLGERVAVRRADATRLPFDDKSFDTVLSFIMLHHVIDWERAFSEVTRVLRPGGEFIGYDLSDSTLARIVHRVDRSPHRLATPRAVRAVIGALPLEGEVRPRLASQVMTFSLTRQ